MRERSYCRANFALIALTASCLGLAACWLRGAWLSTNLASFLTTAMFAVVAAISAAGLASIYADTIGTAAGRGRTRAPRPPQGRRLPPPPDEVLLTLPREEFPHQRQRLALDVHDQVIPNLTAALMYLEAGDNQRPVSKEAVQQAITLVRGSLEQSRQVMNRLITDPDEADTPSVR